MEVSCSSGATLALRRYAGFEPTVPKTKAYCQQFVLACLFPIKADREAVTVLSSGFWADWHLWRLVAPDISCLA